MLKKFYRLSIVRKIMSFARRFQQRLLNSDKWQDYIFVSTIAFIPIFFSKKIGIWDTVPYLNNQHTSYSEANNFTWLTLVLPLSLCFLRILMNLLFGLKSNLLFPVEWIPILNMFDNPESKRKIRKKLKNTAENPIIPLITFVVSLLHHYLDTKEIFQQYYMAFRGVPISSIKYNHIYWANIYLVNCKQFDPDITKNITINFWFTVSAYLAQFTIIFIAYNAIILLLVHNIFYLRIIYQRYRVKEGETFEDYIVLDFEDDAKCFGQRKLFFIFNLQLNALVFAGICTLLSRYTVTGERIDFNINNRDFWSLFNIKFSFPEFGQYAILLAWLFAFLVILLPSFVKFLPLVSPNVIRSGYNPIDYLEEFIPPNYPNPKYKLKDQNNKPIKQNLKFVADNFQKNSFWPVGDNTARWVLYYVFFVFLTILFPFNYKNVINWLIFIPLALILGSNFFNLYKWGLKHIIDDILVNPDLNYNYQPSDNKDKKIKILFLAANPYDTPRINVDKEKDLIDTALRNAKYDKFDFVSALAVRVEELQGLLRKHQPHILHFSGHGSQESEIILQDNNGNSYLVPEEGFSELFSIPVLKGNIICVVLNACYTEEQAKNIAKHIDIVVGMSKAITDKAAICFVTEFYRALADDDKFYQGLDYRISLEAAFKQGRAQIKMEYPDEKDTPKIEFKKDSGQS